MLTRLAIFSHDENKKAIGDLTKQMTESFEKLEKNHEGSLSKQEHRTIRLIVRPSPNRRLNPRAILPVRSKHNRQPQVDQTSTTAASPHFAVAHDSEQPQIKALSDSEQVLTVGSAESQDQSDDQLVGHAPEIGPDTPSHQSPFLDAQVGFELPSLPDGPESPDQANDIEITFEDGSIAVIPGGTDHDDGDDNEGVKTQVALVKTTGKLPITRTTGDTNIPLSDAEELVEFLRRDPGTNRALAPVGAALTKAVNISMFRFEFPSSDSEDDSESDMESNPTVIRFLCVEKFSFPDEQKGPLIVNGRPCHEFPWCDHASIELPGGGMSADELLTRRCESPY